MRNLLLLLILILAFGCTTYKTTWTHAQYKNVPGIVAVVKRFQIGPTINDFKYPVHIFDHKYERYRPKCTGTLVKPNAVLTAAHCIDDLKLSQIGIVYKCDIIYDDSSCSTTTVTAVARKDIEDIGLLILSDNLNTNGIHIVPISSSRPEKGQYLLLSGFGTNGILQAGMAQVWSVFPYSYDLDIRNMTRPEPGDSGGPAYIIQGNKLLLSGVTSRFTVLKDKVVFFQGIKYKDASIHKKWIDEQYKKLTTKLVTKEEKQ